MASDQRDTLHYYIHTSGWCYIIQYIYAIIQCRMVAVKRESDTYKHKHKHKHRGQGETVLLYEQVDVHLNNRERSVRVSTVTCSGSSITRSVE